MAALEVVGEVPRLKQVGLVNAALVSLLGGLWIAIGEVDHLLSQVLDAGRSWSPNALTGPFVAKDYEQTVDAWDFLAGSEKPGWLVSYVALDAALAVVYTLLLLRALLYLCGCRVSRTSLVIVAAAGLADLAEGLLILVSVKADEDALGTVRWALPAASGLKWALLAIALALLATLARDRLGGWVSHGWWAAYTHRYSVLVVLPLGVLGVARGPDILEQVPDIQRSWTDGDGAGWDCVSAAVVTGVLTLVCFVIGRQRTHHLWSRTEGVPEDHGADRPRPLVWVWLLGPVLLVTGAAVTDDYGADIGRARLAAFCGVPVLVAVISWCLRTRHDRQAAEHDKDPRKPAPRTQPSRKGVSRARFDAAAWLGDVLPPLLIVVCAWGSIRAFTAVLALGQLSALGGWLFFGGWVALVACWPLWRLVVLDPVGRVGDGFDTKFGGQGPGGGASPAATRRERVLAMLVPGTQRVRGSAGSPEQLPAWSSLALGIVGVAGVALFPVVLAEHTGVIATFQLALGSLSLLIAAVVILFQRGGAPEAFWPLGMPFVPVTSLVVASCVFATLLGGGADVHGIRTVNAGAAPGPDPSARPDLTTVFGTWLEGTRACGRPPETGADELELRPLVLIAAEGGGIRAAYWTTAILDQLVSTARETRGGRVCAQAMVSSGASGGSVGLSIASVSSPGAASIQTEKIAQPRALAAASDGLVLRDTIYAATGVPVPSLSDGTSEHDTPWLDRASLIEQAWENDESGIAELDEPFLDAPLAWAEWGPPGAMVLNSTSSTTACRTLVSQVELPLSSDPGSADRTAGVCSPSGGVAGSTDLIDCTGPLRTTTAALLTARFPYVTPSGVVSCDDGDPDTDDEQQIVDGGYAENSGIGTLVDVMPSIMRLVRAHNSCVISRLDAAPAVETEGDCDAAPTTVVVPLLLYLDNGTGSDLVERPGGLSPEIVVPPATLLSSMASLVSARSQLQRAQALLATDQLWGEDLAETHEVVAAVEAMRPKGAAYVAYQATTPSIGAPLGWVLSDTSICTIERSLASGAQDQGFGFGTLSAFTKASLGVTYAGSDDSHC